MRSIFGGQKDGGCLFVFLSENVLANFGASHKRVWNDLKLKIKKASPSPLPLPSEATPLRRKRSHRMWRRQKVMRLTSNKEKNKDQ